MNATQDAYLITDQIVPTHIWQQCPSSTDVIIEYDAVIPVAAGGGAFQLTNG